jgi:micrococcal nuclease
MHLVRQTAIRARLHPLAFVATVAFLILGSVVLAVGVWFVAVRSRTIAPAPAITQIGPSSAASVDVFSGVVVRAIDGDTVELSDGRRIRYIGVDAPEAHAAGGAAATARNRDLVQGKTVRLEFDHDRHDRFGRVLAHVWVGENLVTVELASEGLVATALFPPNLLHADALLKAQEEARIAHRGVWSTQ